jgi:Na+-driven multidrug efflux pump
MIGRFLLLLQPAQINPFSVTIIALAERDTQGPLVSIGIAFILNVIGTLTLVRKTSLGITGAAIGTLCADIAATSFLLCRVKQSRDKKKGKKESSQLPLLVLPTLQSFQRFVRYAAPIFFTILGKSVVYNGIALTVGRLGSVALAAHQVLLRSFFFWCPVGDSVGMTSQVFLPGILEEERKTGVPKRGAKRLLFSTGVLAGLVASVMAYLLPSKGAALFTKDAQVAAALARTAPILGLSISMHAITLTCEGMLLAQRDLGFLSNSYITTTIATAALLLSPFRPVTLDGSWWILALFQLSRSLQFTLRNIVLNRRRERKLACH